MLLGTRCASQPIICNLCCLNPAEDKHCRLQIQLMRRLSTAVIHPFNLRLLMFVLIYHMHMCWRGKTDFPRKIALEAAQLGVECWLGPSVAQWDSVRHLASKCCGVVVVLLPMLQVMACCAACCWIHAGFGFSEYFIFQTVLLSCYLDIYIPHNSYLSEETM